MLLTTACMEGKPHVDYVTIVGFQYPVVARTSTRCLTRVARAAGLLVVDSTYFWMGDTSVVFDFPEGDSAFGQQQGLLRHDSTETQAPWLGAYIGWGGTRPVDYEARAFARIAPVLDSAISLCALRVRGARNCVYRGGEDREHCHSINTGPALQPN